MYNSYYAVIFAGISTNRGSFEHIGREIKKQLKLSKPGCRVKVLTIYPYDDSISGDPIADSLQVMKNAYALCGNTAKDMAYEIMKKYSGEECVFFVGYSGGGIAATVVAERLKKQLSVSKILRVGSPVLTVGKPLYPKTADLSLPGDPVCQVEIPRFFKNFRPYQCFVKDLVVNRHVHSCYFKEDLKDENGVSNLTKTIGQILRFVKN
ncbi:MAG: hypothetical protein WCX81_01315 [Monoglobales bacterium]